MSRDPRKAAAGPRTETRTPRTDIDVRQLRAFVALVDHGSVTAAARAIRLAQSTVSESLAGLERALGADVLVRRRGAREPSLTAAGRALLPHARAVLAAVEAARGAVARAATEARGIVGIIANESVSTYMLPRALAPLRRWWPKTRFTVSVAACPGVRAGVEDGAFDAGLLLEPANRAAIDPPARRGSVSRAGERIVIADDVPLVVFAASTHALAAGRMTRPCAGMNSARVRCSSATPPATSTRCCVASLQATTCPVRSWRPPAASRV